MPHPGDICATNVLATVHLAVVDDSLPRVVASASLLNCLVIGLLELLVGFALLLDLLLPLGAPLVKFGLAVDSPLFLLSILLLHLVVEASLALLLGNLSVAYSLAFLIIKVVVELIGTEARGSRNEAPVLGRGNVLATLTKLLIHLRAAVLEVHLHASIEGLAEAVGVHAIHRHCSKLLLSELRTRVIPSHKFKTFHFDKVIQFINYK